MRYLGKVASILSLRADLEHVHVSVVCFYVMYLMLMNHNSNCYTNFKVFKLFCNYCFLSFAMEASSVSGCFLKYMYI